VETNKKIGTPVLSIEPPEVITDIPKLCIYPVSSIEILSSLQFNEPINMTFQSIKETIGGKYNGIHFRLDLDCIIHYVFGTDVYNHFMDLANNSQYLAMEYYKTLNIDSIDYYCSFLMKQYLKNILTFGFDKKWYICTSIKKWKYHQPMEKYLDTLVTFITSNGGDYFIPKKMYLDRELNALVDLLVLRDSTKLIGFQGSSFSEGYCYKVNSIRKVTQEYLFVKERE
jgi:hypothetical protein